MKLQDDVWFATIAEIDMVQKSNMAIKHGNILEVVSKWSCRLATNIHSLRGQLVQ